MKRLTPEGIEYLERRMNETFGIGHDEYEYQNEGRVPQAHLGNAIRIIDNSGILEELEKWDRARRVADSGRKPIIPMRAVLVLFLLHVQQSKGVTYHEMAKTLRLRFGPKEFERLGIPSNRPSSQRLWYERLWAASQRLLSLIDPYPSQRRHCMTPEEYEQWRHDMDTEAGRDNTAAKLARINWLCQRLVTASVELLPRDIWELYRGNIAGDATKVLVAGGKNPTDPTFKRRNPDPLVGRYRREGNHEGGGAKTDESAYELENAVMVWNAPGEVGMFPFLTLAVSFHRPGQLRGHGVYLTRTVQEAYGFGRITTVWDRAYNDGEIETFHIPMRKMGADLVVDYKAARVGVQGFFKDLVLLDGVYYWNRLPADLIEVTAELERLYSAVKLAEKTLRDAKRHTGKVTTQSRSKQSAAQKVLAGAGEEESRLRRLIAARDRYRMLAHGNPDADGFQRFSYPKEPDLATGEMPPRKSITVPMLVPQGTSKEKGKAQPIKYLQKFPHESEVWWKWYGMRSLVESSHKLMKQANTEDLENAKKRSGRGFAFHYLASTLAVVSSNIRRIIAFFRDKAEQLGTPKTRTSRRRDHLGSPLARRRSLEDDTGAIELSSP